MSLAPNVSASNLSHRILGSASLAIETFDSSVELYYEIQNNPEISTFDAFSLLSGELVAIPLNIGTSIPRALGVNSSNRFTGRQIKSLAESYVETIPSLLNKATDSYTNNSFTNWLGNKFYNWGLYW